MRRRRKEIKVRRSERGIKEVSDVLAEKNKKKTKAEGMMGLAAERTVSVQRVTSALLLPQATLLVVSFRLSFFHPSAFS